MVDVFDAEQILRFRLEDRAVNLYQALAAAYLCLDPLARAPSRSITVERDLLVSVCSALAVALADASGASVEEIGEQTRSYAQRARAAAELTKLQQLARGPEPD